jgi:carbon storage regulator
MLVLSRKRLETLRIGDDVTVTIVDIRGDKVRIGVEAPKDKIVYRQEVWDAMRRNEDGEVL